jgi:hypothetical protein
MDYAVEVIMSVDFGLLPPLSFRRHIGGLYSWQIVEPPKCLSAGGRDCREFKFMSGAVRLGPIINRKQR